MFIIIMFLAERDMHYRRDYFGLPPFLVSIQNPVIFTLKQFISLIPNNFISFSYSCLTIVNELGDQ